MTNEMLDALRGAVTEKRLSQSEIFMTLGHLTGRVRTCDGMLICTVNGRGVAEKYFGWDYAGVENYGRTVVTRHLREMAAKLIAEFAK